MTNAHIILNSMSIAQKNAAIGGRQSQTGVFIIFVRVSSLTLSGQTCGLNYLGELDLLVQVQHGNVIVESVDVEFGVHHRLLDLADDCGAAVHVQSVVHAHVNLDFARVEPANTRENTILDPLPGS